MVKNSIPSLQFEISRSGVCFAKAGYVAFEMMSELRTGTEESYGIETGIN